MDYHDPPCDYLFVDLDSEDERVRNEVLSYLYSRDAKLELPWKTFPQKAYTQHEFANPTSPINPNLNNFNFYQTTQYPGKGEPHPLNHVYPQKFTPQQQQQVFVNSSNNQIIQNYPYTSLTVQQTNAATATVKPLPVQQYSAVSDNTPNEIQAQPTISGNVANDRQTQSAVLSNTANDTQTIDTKLVAAANQVTVNGTVCQTENKLTNGVGVAPAAPKSWASLFNKQSANKAVSGAINGCDKQRHSLTAAVVEEEKEVDDEFSRMKKALKAKYDDPIFHRMGEYLFSHALDHRINSLQPRGLINRSNYCYINSILQALLACPPMYNLLHDLSKENILQKDKLPIISGMCRFIKEFHHLPAGQRVVRRPDKSQKKDQSTSINCDVPFEPTWIYKMLSGMRSDSFVVEGRQEDAEEFLGCLLNGLNDEMLDLIKLVSSEVSKPVTIEYEQDEDDSEKEWKVMGPKNKGSITRRTEFSETPISNIFGGLLRSRIHRAGDQCTDNIQPFFTLPLNIDTKKEMTTVKDALDLLVTRNELEGLTSSKTNEKVEAWQQVTIEELPIVLVLHFKCFDFKLDGCTKIIKTLEFPIDLKMDNKLLSTKSSSSSKEKQYKLFAVVYHDGKEATKGHYVTDAYHVGYASWLRYDDASVKAVQEENVLNPQGTRVPYLLFYRRSDSLKSK